MPGRMIQDSISRSDGISKLSPKGLALFCLILPHLNAHGKMAAELGMVKGLCCPKIKWLPLRSLRRYLEEISRNTNLKWFQSSDGLYYLHALNFQKHQPGLRLDRMAKISKLPDYSWSTPGVVRREVEVNGSEIEVNGAPDGSRIEPPAPEPHHHLELARMARKAISRGGQV